MALDLERAGQCLDQLAGDRPGVAGRTEVTQQDGELIAPRARHRVAGTQIFGDAYGRLAQQSIAGGVAQRVVGALEAIQVQEQDADAGAVALRVCQLLGKQRQCKERQASDDGTIRTERSDRRNRP